MDVKKIAAGAVIAGALGLPALSLGVGVESESARRPRTLGRAGHQTATATATGETVIRDDRISGKGTSGDRISGDQIRVAGTNGDGISAASTMPVSTISPSTGKVNRLSRTGTKTAVRGASGS